MLVKIGSLGTSPSVVLAGIGGRSRASPHRPGSLQGPNSVEAGHLIDEVTPSPVSVHEGSVHHGKWCSPDGRGHVVAAGVVEKVGPMLWEIVLVHDHFIQGRIDLLSGVVHRRVDCDRGAGEDGGVQSGVVDGDLVKLQGGRGAASGGSELNQGEPL